MSAAVRASRSGGRQASDPVVRFQFNIATFSPARDAEVSRFVADVTRMEQELGVTAPPDPLKELAAMCRPIAGTISEPPASHAEAGIPIARSDQCNVMPLLQRGLPFPSSYPSVTEPPTCAPACRLLLSLSAISNASLSTTHRRIFGPNRTRVRRDRSEHRRDARSGCRTEPWRRRRKI